jgi:small nuclear ribonucleoprotein (snRNP)-like protein
MQEVRQMLDSPLRVGLTDGRVIIGRFACLDKQRNILLVEARESRSNGDDSSGRRERHLGTVLVPRQWVTTCHCPLAS